EVDPSPRRDLEPHARRRGALERDPARPEQARREREQRRGDPHLAHEVERPAVASHVAARSTREAARVTPYAARTRAPLGGGRSSRASTPCPRGPGSVSRRYSGGGRGTTRLHHPASGPAVARRSIRL